MERAVGLRVKAPLRQQGGEVCRLLPVGVEHQIGVLGELLRRHLLHRVVQAHRAGGDADGQQQHEADHRHGAVGGVDAGVELPQDEHVEVFIVELLPAPAHPQQEAGQGAEEQQGAQAAQADHHPEQGVHPQDAPGEQHGVGDGKQSRPGQEENHRQPQALAFQLLVHPLGLHQIDEPASGDGEGVVGHHQQEDSGEGQGGLAQGGQGDGEGEHGHGHGEQPGGECGQAPGRQHPQPQAHQQGQQAHARRLQQQEPGHLAPPHAQQQIGAQLLLPPADEEAGGVEDQKGQHHPHKDGEHAHQLPDGLGGGGGGPAAQVLEHRLGLQGVEHVEQAHGEHDGEEPHPVVLHAAAHVFGGQLREHRSGHLPARSPRR